MKLRLGLSNLSTRCLSRVWSLDIQAYRVIGNSTAEKSAALMKEYQMKEYQNKTKLWLIFV